MLKLDSLIKRKDKFAIIKIMIILYLFWLKLLHNCMQTKKKIFSFFQDLELYSFLSLKKKNWCSPKLLVSSVCVYIYIYIYIYGNDVWHSDSKQTNLSWFFDKIVNLNLQGILFLWIFAETSWRVWLPPKYTFVCIYIYTYVHFNFFFHYLRENLIFSFLKMKMI